MCIRDRVRKTASAGKRAHGQSDGREKCLICSTELHEKANAHCNSVSVLLTFRPSAIAVAIEGPSRHTLNPTPLRTSRASTALKRTSSPMSDGST
eukprot:4752364-Prymnesium_polylepis.1